MTLNQILTSVQAVLKVRDDLVSQIESLGGSVSNERLIPKITERLGEEGINLSEEQVKAVFTLERPPSEKIILSTGEKIAKKGRLPKNLQASPEEVKRAKGKLTASDLGVTVRKAEPIAAE
jgi:hypothetical protein